MGYRRLRDKELNIVATVIRLAEYANNILRFAREIYGSEAYQVLIQDDGDTYGGLAVENVEVTNQGSNEFMPDFNLPYWQEEIAHFPDLFEGCHTWKAQFERVKEHIKDHGLYEEYNIDPEASSRGVIVLSELEGRYTYPELYMKEED